MYLVYTYIIVLQSFYTNSVNTICNFRTKRCWC